MACEQVAAIAAVIDVGACIRHATASCAVSIVNTGFVQSGSRGSTNALTVLIHPTHPALPRRRHSDDAGNYPALPPKNQPLQDIID